jgi:hypothetical protein
MVTIKGIKGREKQRISEKDGKANIQFVFKNNYIIDGNNLVKQRKIYNANLQHL